MELDSHADTTALGDTCLVLQDTGRTVNVEGFGESIGTLEDVPIVTAAVAYDCPATFTTYVLIFHESLHIPDMETDLINPYQLRDQGIIVNDVALQHLPPSQRQMKSHSILSEDPPMHIPLNLKGTMSGFTVRKPTWDEIRDADQHKVTFVHMTSDIKWKPHSKDFATIENALRDDVTRGIDLHQKESRDLCTMQVRGQSGESQQQTMLFNACNALRMPVDQDCYKELGNGSNSTGAAAVEVRNVSVEGTTEDHCDGNFGEQVCAMRVQ